MTTSAMHAAARAALAGALLAASPASTAAATPAPGPASQEETKAKRAAYDAAMEGSKRVEQASRKIATGDLAGAEKDLIAADKQVPDYCTVLLPLSNVQFRLGKHDEALATLERAIRRGKAFDDKAYLLAARIFSIRKQFAIGETKLIEWAGDRPVTANFHASIGILRMGAYELAKAELELREALAMDPGNEAALTGMTELYGRLDQYPKLQKFLDDGLAKNPNSVALLILTGNSLLRQERYAEAKDKFERVLRIDPKNTTATINLGACLHGLGDTAGAIAAFRKATELEPSNTEATVNLARALEKSGRPGEARDILLAARKRGLDSIEILNSLVVAHRLNKEWDAAAAAAAESLERSPNQPLLKKYLAEMDEERRGGAAATPASAPAVEGLGAPLPSPPAAPAKP